VRIHAGDLLAAEAVDGGRARVARGGADDGDARARRLLEQVLERVAEVLQRHVLEREGGAVEEL